ncbi:MAG: adenylate/guanylate cyclase domain-containing protein [Alphaproteobacteria bacterium]|nr:adenylate/guanylate cyclase domain-containing protein [Alphaproteobacteria bacterium]MCW5740650.1 adenylate/guanylate cyclase domain-containing protein [Alphaproteobacteria bacterium]
MDLALAAAERRGFRLGVIGRTCALVAIAAFYLIAISWPNNLLPAAALLAVAGIGLVPLVLVGGRYERAARFVIFACDMAAISAVLAFAPISTGGDVPQNFVFLTSRPAYYYVVLAVSILSLSPALVLWTGLCAVLGMTGATAWIMSGMEQVVSYGGLPASPTRDQYLAVVLNLNFLALPTRVAEALVMALSTGIAALAVHRARNMVRDHAAVEEKRNRVQRLLGRYVPEQVAEQLVDSGQLAPQLREASVLFADIEGFTGLSERLSPHELIAVLNSFFGAATAIVDERGGIVVNHVGDALIAAFNTPIAVAGHGARAIDAACALQALMAARDFEGHRLRLRIGVATGPVAAGAVGDARRQTYTIYGDTVNLAQRLERLNKDFETHTLVCGATFAGANAMELTAERMGTVQVRGRESAVEVFALR